MTDTTNTADVIDSRDILERISELEDSFSIFQGDDEDKTIEDWLNSGDDEATEYVNLTKLAEEASQYSSDWEYGEALIRYDYFEQYMDEMVADCYELPKDLPYWMNITYDYEALKQDYASVDYDGIEYYIRSV